MNNTCVLTVNYNTPELLRECVGSIREWWPTIHIVVVDGSDQDDLAAEVEALARADMNMKLYQLGHNIHHGPGIDYAMKRIKEDYVFLLDTDDRVLRRETIEAMHELMTPDVYAVGELKLVDDCGDPKPADADIPYVFPMGMLLNREQYLKFPPAALHDGPFFDPMEAIHLDGESDKRLRHFPNIGMYVKRGDGVTRIQFAEPEKCNKEWLLCRQDKINREWAELSQRRIVFMGPENSDVEYGIDMLEAMRENPTRLEWTLRISEYRKGEDTPSAELYFPNFQFKQLAAFFHMTLKAVAEYFAKAENTKGWIPVKTRKVS